MLALTYKLYNTKFQLRKEVEVIQSYEIIINRLNTMNLASVGFFAYYTLLGFFVLAMLLLLCIY